MTDSPLLEEVLAAVLAEHTGYSLMSPHCFCGARLDKPKGNPQSAWHAHVAERLAARLLAHRDLLLEALGGERTFGVTDTRGPLEPVWRFPVSEEVQT